ncbi:NAD(P)/FAD-dependent oxidoreductase [Nocardioides sp. JQ2195]|uniref:flavin-containing monooxygenase n=1 Tax=Nocardioides sp. JQ2195 TaxID=2592334 RepID=UPI00143EBE9C|nr:NAD(P)/FAD-dependent oxidoreductase [Nocardioides sp. JQ2195]QIX27229.1 NAD(P)/FAD-dependent oxidoreductase [Nocardioides sp. JQ2195]
MTATDTNVTGHYKVVVIGAGFGGMYALHQLRSEGIPTICFEAGGGVGGTWYWNRYPGARVDIESMQYSYSFDEELQQDWSWPENFSAQPDIERYANHVADRFGLREDIAFNARVDSLRFDEDTHFWHLTTERGDEVTARFVISATGSLDATNVPNFAGLDSFEGDWHHTSQWPEEGVSFDGKRVGVIGTGSSGVQIIPEIAKTAASLQVFQRTPAFTMPNNNQALDPDYEREWKENYAERREATRSNYGLTRFPPPHGPILEMDPADREALMEDLWASQAGFNLLVAFSDTAVSTEANEILGEFVRNKIRSIVTDPEVAEKLCPRYAIGTKRVCLDSGYHATYNRENVTLVDVRESPIEEITPRGIRTSSGEHELDILVLATGFDAVSGSLTRLNVTGVGGQDLRDKWKDGATNYLGMFVAGFPNLFMIHGPGSPGVLAQMIAGAEWQVQFVLDIIRDLDARGVERIDTTAEWENKWDAEVEAAASYTLFGGTDSWYKGSNIEGKPKSFMVYVGGYDNYSRRCREQVEADYEGFVLIP